MEARDADDFGQFMASRWPGLVRLAYGLTGDRWLAEDIAQAALASAYAAWWRVRRADDPDAYVRRILINACNSRFRRRRVTEDLHAMAELPDTGLADPSDVVGDVRRWWPRCASCRRGSARSWCSVTWRT